MAGGRSVGAQHPLEKKLQLAAELAAAGKSAAAQSEYAKVLLSKGCKSDPLLRGAAALGFTQIVLGEHLWTELEGKHPDQILLEALRGAQAAKQRSRTLEGQLQLIRSRALFAKPGKTADCLDAALEARTQAVDLLLEAEVEALQWPVEKIQALVDRLVCDESGTALDCESLIDVLRRESFMSAEDAEEHVETLVDSWSPGGRISVQQFLGLALEIAQRLTKTAEKALAKTADSCSAPCEGGLPEGSTAIEKELVLLVSRHGAADWESKAEELQKKGFNETPRSLEDLWTQLVPQIKKTVDADDPMACGHSCSTCPTKDDCKVHDALRDIEDM